MILIYDTITHRHIIHLWGTKTSFEDLNQEYIKRLLRERGVGISPQQVCEPQSTLLALIILFDDSAVYIGR